MRVAFDQLAPNSRIWIYQSSKKLTAEEIKTASAHINQFLDQWQAHGKDLKAGFSFKYDQFLIIGVDENVNAASGCSIDASVHFLQDIEHQLDMRLMDRSLVAFLKNEPQGKKVLSIPLSQIKEFVSKGAISENDYVFDNTIQQKQQLEQEWIVPVKACWTKRYFKEYTV